MPVPTRAGSTIQTWTRPPYVVTTDPAAIDLEVVYHFLTESYWARGIPRDVVALSLENCLPFGIYKGGQQVGGARVITDCATFAYIDDVFVLTEHRGRGLGRWLIECIRAHPDLQGLRRWELLTEDAQVFYRPFGFAPLEHPEWTMEIAPVDYYVSGASTS